jgi:hypothetical protein
MKEHDKAMCLAIILLVAWLLFGCSAPLIQSEININDSANGNTVTPIP